MTRSDDEREFARLIAMSDVEFLVELHRALRHSEETSPLLRAASFHLSMAMSDSEDDDEEEA